MVRTCVMKSNNFLRHRLYRYAGIVNCKKNPVGTLSSLDPSSFECHNILTVAIFQNLKSKKVIIDDDRLIYPITKCLVPTWRLNYTSRIFFAMHCTSVLQRLSY